MGKGRAWLILEADWLDDPKGLFINCPRCRTPLRHVAAEVSAAGAVVPELDCPLCDFCDLVRLAGWKLREALPGGITRAHGCPKTN